MGMFRHPSYAHSKNVDDEDGMAVEQQHVQVIVNTTFRVKTVDQLEKEKKAARAVTQHYDITEDIDSENDDL